MALSDNDARSTRCRRLGHAVTFGYCRTQEGDSVCPHVLDCWRETFDVRSFLAEHLPEDELGRMCDSFARGKVVSLIELAQQARQSGSPGG